MIQTLVAYTEEIDDIQEAVGQVKTQLGEQFLRNTVGIITCHYEFVNSGVVEALCGELPFPVAGTITSAQAVGAATGSLLLTLMVLTSDDTVFKTALTDSLLGEPSAAIEQAYNGLSGGVKPAMIWAFAPFLPQNSGDEYVATLTKLSNNAPCFGTLAVDDTATFENCFVIYNGIHYHDRMAIVLLYGDVKPTFFIASVSESKIISRAALVTSSEGHLLKEVNGRPLLEFFDALGLTSASESSYALTSLPLMLDYGDGMPLVSKAFIMLDENKNGIYGGAIPEGSTLYVSAFERNDVLFTTGRAVREALSGMQEASGVLLFSCIGRFLTLGASSLEEFDLVRDEIGDKVPFMMACSGGELCPTHFTGDDAVNRFHNNSFVVCVF